jgi:hypothetical protein
MEPLSAFWRTSFNGEDAQHQYQSRRHVFKAAELPTESKNKVRNKLVTTPNHHKFTILHER